MPRHELLEQMIDALQVIVVLAARLSNETSADASNIRVATDRVILIVKQLREGGLS